jgi:hypothetical protein
VLRITTFSGGKKEMAFEYKRQFPGEKTNNGHGAATHDSTADGAPNRADAPVQAADPDQADDPDPAQDLDPVEDLDQPDDPMRLPEPARLDRRVLRYVPVPPVPRDLGREQADKRAGSQSVKSLRLRQHLDCEPPWDISRARASYDSPASPREPWPNRFDVWPTDMAGYWPCPICDTPLVPVDRTPMKVFRCRTCDTQTFVHVKAPVVECPHHGRHEIALPWRQNGMKWSYLGTEPSDSTHPTIGMLRDLTPDGGETEH